MDLPEDNDSDLSSIEDAEDAIAKFENIDVPKVQRGMFVSGWDDPDDLIEEDQNPHATLDREILWAAEGADLELAESILKKDPNCVKATDRDGYTPLHRAAYENNFEMAQLLLKYKADVGARTEFGWTPLHSACKWNNARLAALLLQHGADVNARSDGDQTPLHVAATVSSCRDTMVTLLNDPNVDPGILNNSKETAFQIARRTGTTYPAFDMAKPALEVHTGFID